MTKEEKELFNEKIKGIYAAIQANADLQYERDQKIFQKLDHIVEQTTKTNGTVKKNCEEIEELKIADISHLNKCPVKPRVEKIEKTLMKYTGAGIVILFLVNILIKLLFGI